MSKEGIDIYQLGFSYPDSPSVLFDDFSSQIPVGWTCLSGANGCGKTTLLQLVAGILSPQSGHIDFSGSVQYCEQRIDDIPSTLWEAFQNGKEAARMFSLFDIHDEQLYRWETLSGGERKRIQIACALACEPDVILLDEPTNHLDSRSAAIIVNALHQFLGTGIAVTHDRGFSSAVCTRTLYLYRGASELENGRDCIEGTMYPSSLEQALLLRKETLAAERSEWNRLDSERMRLGVISSKLEAENVRSKSRLSKRHIDSRDHDAQAKIDGARVSGKDRSSGDAKSRFDSRIDHVEQQLAGRGRPLMRKTGFSLSSSVPDSGRYVPQTLVRIEPCSICAGEYKLSVPDLEITGRSRIGISGDNGTGKTLLLKYLEQHAAPESGVLYLEQEISADRAKEVVEAFLFEEDDVKGKILSVLYRLGSRPESLLYADGMLSENVPPASPGEIQKLLIARAAVGAELSGNPLHLLLLDEPTNHMDIVSVAALEEALSAMQCALVIVSHDGVFLSHTVETFWHITRNGNEGFLEK